MSNPFVAEIRILPFNFAPKGWAFCDGQILPISQNTALFSLLGTTYGGNGTSNFALPNLQGAAPLHWGQGSGLSLINLGQSGGVSAVTLLSSQMPVHSHTVDAQASSGNTNDPTNHVWAEAHSGKAPLKMYSTAQPNVTMSPTALSPAGGGLPHNNLPTYLTLNFCIALVGVFPSRP
jgi:microcystin-dependent protein